VSGRQFCRDLCLERGEPLEGTGDAPRRILMLAWPRGKWRTPRWESVDMSPALTAALHAASQAGLHVALVDRVGETGSLPQLQALPESVAADFDSEDALVAAILNYVEGTVFAGRRDPRTTILCCTDSRRDACCARYGFSTYKALVAVADPDLFNIVQATHLGGCRFAASLVVMPQRQRYGRMTAGLAPAFLAALQRDEIFLPSYKGATDQPEAYQIAEIAALTWASENLITAPEIRIEIDSVPDQPAEGALARLRAVIGEHQLDIRLQARVFHIQGNCETVAQGGGAHLPRWCLDQVLPLGDAWNT